MAKVKCVGQSKKTNGRRSTAKTRHNTTLDNNSISVVEQRGIYTRKITGSVVTHTRYADMRRRSSQLEKAYVKICNREQEDIELITTGIARFKK